MPSVDLALIACFALSCFWCDKRDSLFCLLALLLSIAAFLSPANSSYTHLIISVIYSSCIFFVSLRIKRVMLAISLFQYIMAIDSFIFPQTETFLYVAYPYVAFALNLLLLMNLGQGGRNGVIDSTFDSIRPCWFRHIRSFPLHQKRNAGR